MALKTLRRLATLTPAMTLGLGTMPGMAQDFYVNGGAALEYEVEPGGAGTDNVLDINGYVEVEKAGFYAGLWVEKSSDDLRDKADIYIGYRSETPSGLGYYVDLTRREYFNDTGDYTVVDVGASLALGERLSATVDLSHYLEDSVNDAYLGVSFAATDKLSLVANYGSYGVVAAPDEQEWDFGVEFALSDEVAVNLSYYDGTEYVEGYVGLSLAWDTTFLSR